MVLRKYYRKSEAVAQQCSVKMCFCKTSQFSTVLPRSCSRFSKTDFDRLGLWKESISSLQNFSLFKHDVWQTGNNKYQQMTEAAAALNFGPTD